MITPLVVTITIWLIVFILYVPRDLSYDCFLLTLPESAERQKTFFRHFSKHVPITVVHGHDTKKVENARKFEKYVDPKYLEKAIEMSYDPTVIRPNITYFNLGAIGCMFGHLDVFKRAQQRGSKYALVFEDNTIVRANRFYRQVEKVIDKLGDDFEMVFFHCLSRLPDPKDDTGDKLERVKWISSTKCYLVHVPNMTNYINLFLPMNNHVDQKVEDLIKAGARVYYRDMRGYLKINRTVNSTIGHNQHHRPDFYSKNYPDATRKSLKYGY